MRSRNFWDQSSLYDESITNELTSNDSWATERDENRRSWSFDAFCSTRLLSSGSSRVPLKVLLKLCLVWNEVLIFTWDSVAVARVFTTFPGTYYVHSLGFCTWCNFLTLLLVSWCTRSHTVWPVYTNVNQLISIEERSPLSRRSRWARSCCTHYNLPLKHNFLWFGFIVNTKQRRRI